MSTLSRLRTVSAIVVLGLGLSADLARAQGPLTNGLNHTGAISSAGELDSWTFTASSGSSIVIRMGEIGGDSDLYPYLQLYGPNNALITSDSGTVVAQVAATAAQAGTYTVVARTADSGMDALGDYTLTLALAPGTPSVSSGDEGGPMTNGANHVANIHVGDMDQWTFTAASGSSIVIRMGEIGGDSVLYPYLLLYGPNGNLVTYDSGTVVAQVSATAAQAGAYTVIATTADSGYDAADDYQITLALVAGTPTLQEDAGAMTNGLNHAGDIHVGDLDQWTFTAASGSAIVIRMGEVGGDSELYPYLRLFGPNGAQITYDSGTVVTQVSAVAAQDGVYTVVASTADSGYDAAGDYLITLALVPGTPQITAGDQGGPLVNGRNYAGEIHAGDLDQWTFTATAGSSMVIRIGEVGGNSDLYPYLLLYGPNGALITYDSGVEVAQVSAVAPQNGVYTVVATTADSGFDAAGDYLITLALVAGAPEVSPGDQGGPLTNGLNHAGLIHPGDLDQWTFTATAGASIIVRMGEIGGDSDLYPYLLLYGPNGALVTYDSGAIVTQVSATATVAGTYTVVATTADSGYDASGDYQLTLALVPGTPQLSPGDQGGAMTNGANHAGEIHTGDIDQWTFTAAAGSTIVARIGEVGGDSDLYPYLLLYGPNGALVTYDSGTVVASVSATASQAGAYTLVAMTADSGYDAAGDYLLTLALIPGTPVVPAGDHGGWLTNALTYPGAIHVGDLDQWKFTAIPGAQMNVTVGETGGDSVFYPQVALYGPNGALVTYDSGAVVASITRTLTTPGVYTLVVTTVDSGHDATGSYQISATGIGEPTTPVDLRITKSVTPSVVEPGGSATYTLVATNLSAGNAAAVTVTDHLPAGLVFVSCVAPNGSCGGSGNDRTVTYSTIAAGASQTITLVAAVSAGAGATISNTATIAGGAGETAPADNTATVGLTVQADSLPNEWETRYGLDPGSASGPDGNAGDPDSDGRTNEQEYNAGTHPRGFFSRFLPEGARNAFFDARFAVLNVGNAHGRLLFRFLQSDGNVLSHFIELPQNRRITIDGTVLSQLGTPDFSTVLESDQPIVLDRTMTWADGLGSHAETGVPTPATTWYLAEGATAGDFSLFYLLQNPNAAATVATVKYLLPDGFAPITKTYPLVGNSRTTIFVDVEDPRLAQVAVSAVITTPVGSPIIVERAMYRSTPTQAFAAGHGSSGVTAMATHWFFAEGATGPFFDCFILLANPGLQPANVTINYLLDDGRTFTKGYRVPAEARYTVYLDAEEIPAGSGNRPLETVAVSSTVSSDQPIIAERSMWWPGPAMGGEVWTEAHNSPGATLTGTRWALAEGEVGGPEAAETYILIANTSDTAGSARVTLYFADGASAVKTFPLLPRSRRNVNVSADYPTRATSTFSAVIESLPASGAPAAQIVVERAMYTSPFGIGWAAGTNALGARLDP